MSIQLYLVFNSITQYENVKTSTTGRIVGQK